ncbi:MAG: polymorphic toxin type 33 domain-containing protein [Spirochaetales bacterium]|nr:polymorphic toxin type 33 domain-containing protein [Spirochaetales bacterium]
MNDPVMMALAATAASDTVAVLDARKAFEGAQKFVNGIVDSIKDAVSFIKKKVEERKAKSKKNSNDPNPDRNTIQDRSLGKKEIKTLKEKGIDPEAEKDFQAGCDLFMDKKGNIYIKPKSGKGLG